MDEYLLFEAFERGYYIHKEYLKKVTNYIWGQLILSSPNHSYYQGQFNYKNKLYIVCDWKKAKGLPAVAKKGEAICNDQLAIFFKDEKHKNCSCSVV